MLPEDPDELREVEAEIESLGRLVHTLRLNSKKNLIKKEITHIQLGESMEQTRKIREDMNRRIRTKENRDFLEIIIKNHILELQNIELEINLQLQEKMIAGQHTIALQQKALMEDHHLNMAAEDANLIGNEDNLELEIDSEEENEAVEEQAEDDEDTVELVEEKKIRRNRSSHKGIKQPEDDWEGGRRGREEPKKKELRIPPIKGAVEAPPGNNLEFNLKGFNVKLNEKPFGAPKKKR